MESMKMDNKGMTLLETTLCFVLLGMLLIAASQVIATCTNVFYDTKSTSDGVQAAQAVATEIKGELADAMQLTLVGKNSTYCIYSDGKSIQFIGRDGKQKEYDFSDEKGEKLLVEKTLEDAYDPYYVKSGTYGETIGNDSYTKKWFTREYIGMEYTVTELKFRKFNKGGIPANYIEPLPVENCPVVIMEVTVKNPKLSEFTCTEYIPLYNFGDVDATQLESMIHIP